MPGTKKLIAFTLYRGVSPLDLVGPLTVLRNLAGTRYRTVVVGEHIQPVATDTPLSILPAKTLAEVPEPFGLIVPGGGPATIEAMHHEPLLAYIRGAAGNADLVGSTGTGTLILAAAGLLRGRRAATHWAYRDELVGHGTTIVDDRWVEDGKYLTAAGGSAGIDMALHLLAKLKSRSGARLAQMFMEYDPQPPFGGIDWSGADHDLAHVLRGSTAVRNSREGGRT